MHAKLITIIRMRLSALDSMHPAAINKTAKCISLVAPTQALNMLSSTLPIVLDDTPSLLDYSLRSKLSRCSQVHYEYAPKYTLSTHPSTPQSMFPGTHRDIVSRTLAIAPLAHSQFDRLKVQKQTLKRLAITLPSTLSNTLLMALDDTLPACSDLPSQVYSPEARHFKSCWRVCSHVCTWVLDPETCQVAGTSNQKRDDERWVALPEIRTSVDTIVGTSSLARHGDKITQCLMVMVLSIPIRDSAGKWDNWMFERADFQL